MMSSPSSDKALAYSLARVALGINIAVHGLVRIGHISQFAQETRNQFSQTILPGPLVELTGYGIVVCETCVGLMILLSLWLRPALVAGTLLMLILQFGTCLRQDWNAAGIQLIYIGFYASLLATFQYHAHPGEGTLAAAPGRSP
jgi:thiosulfate dehydrogenase [quinone] large subunit